jgi:hypothetical protein
MLEEVRNTTTAILATAALAASAGAAPALAGNGAGGSFGAPGSSLASAADDTLIAYASSSKSLKAAKKMKYPLICRVVCDARSVATITGPGKNLKVVVTGTLPAGQAVQVELEPNGPLLKSFKDRPGAFTIKTKISATDPLTGETDGDSRNFKVKG